MDQKFGVVVIELACRQTARFYPVKASFSITTSQIPTYLIRQPPVIQNPHHLHQYHVCPSKSERDVE